MRAKDTDHNRSRKLSNKDKDQIYMLVFGFIMGALLGILRIGLHAFH